MTRTMQVAFAMVGAAMMLSAAPPSTARTHELRSHQSTYGDQLGSRTARRHWDNAYGSRAEAPTFRRGPAFDNPPGSAFQDQGERDSMGD
jgi:hypothetical protein